MLIKQFRRYYSSLSKERQELLYLSAYFLLSLVSWRLVNKATAYGSVWLGANNFGDFAVSIRLSHNLAHLFVMGQEATLLMYLSKYQHNPEKQSGLIRWIISSTIRKSLFVFTLVTTALFYPFMPLNWINATIWFGFISIPFVVICGIYERFFLYIKHFFVSFLPRGIYQPICFALIIHLLYKYPPSTTNALLVYAVSFILASIISALYGFYFGFPLSKKYDQSDKKEWHTAGLFYTISTLIIKSTPSIALLLLERLGPTETSVGYFAAICTLIYGFHLLTKPLDSYLKPSIAKLYSANKLDELQKQICYINYFRWMIIALLLTTILFWGHGLLREYGEGFESAYWPLAVTAVFSFLQYLGHCAHEILNYSGHQKELSFIMAVQFAAITLLSAILIPYWDIWGAVWAQGIPCLLATIASCVFLEKKTSIKAYTVF